MQDMTHLYRTIPILASFVRKEQELMKYLTDMYRDEIVKIYSELDSYPSKFESFEAPIKMYVFNKKIFMH